MKHRGSKKGVFENTIIFILSPFLSLPFLFYNLKRGNRHSIVLLAMIMGLISYLYIPAFSNDKTRYLERYEVFKIIDFQGFIKHLLFYKRPDFIFESLVYFFSQSGLNLQILFFLITFFTVFSVFKLAQNITDYIEKLKKYDYIILLLILSITLHWLFSGIRFLFGSAFFLWGIYFFLLKKNTSKGVLFLVTSVLTHFSLLFFIPAVLIYRFFPKINYSLIFKLSLLFLAIPKSWFIEVVPFFEFSETYKSKVQVYLIEDDFMEDNVGWNSQVLYYIRIIWVYVMYVYLFRKKRNGSALLNVTFIMASFLNLIYAIPFAYYRYLSLIKILFAILLINEFIRTGNKKSSVLFFCFFLVTFIVDIYIMRYNFMASLLNIDLLTSPGIILKKITLRDVLD